MKLRKLFSFANFSVLVTFYKTFWVGTLDMPHVRKTFSCKTRVVWHISEVLGDHTPHMPKHEVPEKNTANHENIWSTGKIYSKKSKIMNFAFAKISITVKMSHE